MRRTDLNTLLHAPAEEILAGTANRVEKITVGGECFARRFMAPPRPGTVSRQTEQRIWMQASEVAIAPSLVYWDESSHYCVSKWINHCEDAPINQTIKALNAFHRLDASDAPVVPCTLDLLQLYPSIDLNPEFTSLINSLQHQLANSQLNLVLSHNDLTPQNIRYDGNRVYFIDFEYVGVASPWIDVATLWMTFRQHISLRTLGNHYLKSVGSELDETEHQALSAAAKLTAHLGLAWAQANEPSWCNRFSSALEALEAEY